MCNLRFVHTKSSQSELLTLCICEIVQMSFASEADTAQTTLDKYLCKKKPLSPLNDPDEVQIIEVRAASASVCYVVFIFWLVYSFIYVNFACFGQSRSSENKEQKANAASMRNRSKRVYLSDEEEAEEKAVKQHTRIDSNTKHKTTSTENADEDSEEIVDSDEEPSEPDNKEDEADESDKKSSDADDSDTRSAEQEQQSCGEIGSDVAQEGEQNDNEGDDAEQSVADDEDREGGDANTDTNSNDNAEDSNEVNEGDEHNEDESGHVAAEENSQGDETAAVTEHDEKHEHDIDGKAEQRDAELATRCSDPV